MSKKGRDSGFSGCILNMIIGLVIVFGSLFFAHSQGIDVGGLVHTVFTIVTGKTEEAKKSAKDAQQQFTDKIAETSTEEATSASPVKQEERDHVEPNQKDYEAMPFTTKKRMLTGERDELHRSTWAQVQLNDANRTRSKKETVVDIDVPGWREYRFNYIDAGGNTKKAFLMNREYLVPYVFAGEDSGAGNVAPLTRYVSVGTISDKETDPKNPHSKLFYETAFENWLKKHPTYTLDYRVVPNYEKTELIPRSISLFWSGFDEKGKQIKIELLDSGKATYKGLVGNVTLKNISNNAAINYETGEAAPRYK